MASRTGMIVAVRRPMARRIGVLIPVSSSSVTLVRPRRTPLPGPRPSSGRAVRRREQSLLHDRPPLITAPYQEIPRLPQDLPALAPAVVVQDHADRQDVVADGRRRRDEEEHDPVARDRARLRPRRVRTLHHLLRVRDRRVEPLLDVLECVRVVARPATQPRIHRGCRQLEPRRQVDAPVRLRQRRDDRRDHVGLRLGGLRPGVPHRQQEQRGGKRDHEPAGMLRHLRSPRCRGAFWIGRSAIYRDSVAMEAPRVRISMFRMILRTGTGRPGASHASKKFQLTSPSSLSGSSRYDASRPSGCASRTTNVPAGNTARSLAYAPSSRTWWWPWNGRDAFINDDGVNVTTSASSGSASSSPAIPCWSSFCTITSMPGSRGSTY